MRAASWHSNFKRTPKVSRSCDDIVFDSRAEMLRYRELRLMQSSGLISKLRLKVKFPLILPDGTPIKSKSGRTLQYTCDFEYLDHEINDLVIEDFKGYFDATAKLRIAVFEAIYKVKVRIVTK